MTCGTSKDRDYTYVKCGKFLIIDKQLDYKDSITYCENHGYKLAFVNIKSGMADEKELKANTPHVLKYFGIERNYYRVGLKFEKKRRQLVWKMVKWRNL